MVDTSDEWIRTRTGIATRHIASASETTSDLCVKAAEKALEAAGKTIDDIDFILVATASPDYVVPSTACMVQDKMGAKHAGAMDISAGCSGYIYAVACASNMVKAGMYDNVLVIGAEILSRLVDWQDRSTCILFGDGAGAAVIGQVDEGYGLLASELGSDGSLGKILNIPASGVAEPVTHRAIDSKRIYIHMEGSEVFKAAVRHMGQTTLSTLEKQELRRKISICSLPIRPMTGSSSLLPRNSRSRLTGCMSMLTATAIRLQHRSALLWMRPSGQAW